MYNEWSNLVSVCAFCPFCHNSLQPEEKKSDALWMKLQRHHELKPIQAEQCRKDKAAAKEGRLDDTMVVQMDWAKIDGSASEIEFQVFM